MSRERGEHIDPQSGLRQSRSRKGFSLLELLIVIAVLSILMAVLLPALNTARKTARRTRCQANLKGIGLGYLGYLADNEGSFYGDPTGILDPLAIPKNPVVTFGGWRGKSIRVLHRPINAYLGLPASGASERDAKKLFCCPEDTKANNPKDTLYGTVYTNLGNSYEASRLIITPYELPVEGIAEPWRSINERIRGQRFVTLNTIPQHQGLLWIADYAWISQWDPLSTRCSGWHGRRHYFCTVFLDGHASFVRIKRGIYEYDGYRLQPPFVEGIRDLQSALKCSCGEY